MNLGTVASAYSTFYLFATAMAVGVISVLPFVPLKIIGQRFFILMGLVALAFVALATVSEGLGVSVFYLVFAALAVTA